MTKEITSAANPLIKQLQALVASKKARQASGTFIVEGWRGIKTLLDHESRHYKLEQLVITPDWRNDARLPDSVDPILLATHLFDKISDVKSAQGILGVVRHIVRPFDVRSEKGSYLLLDNLRDPGNLGTLIRSAVGAEFDGVLLYGDCVEPFSPKVIRSTMGTFAFCSIWPVGDNEITTLLEQGYALCITTGRDGDNLYETRFGNKTVLAIGSEAHGVSDVILQRATKKITIPLAKECESLNAAIAGSICMFQLRNA